MFFDSHAHYDDNRFKIDRDEVLTTLPSQGVCGIVNAGSHLTSSKASIKLAEKYPYIYAAVGIHPHEVKDMTEDTLQEIKKLCNNKRVVTIGEIGLDFYYDHSPRDMQRLWFKKQLELSLEVNLPVIVHSREATMEVFTILKESGVRRGVLHSFSGSLQTARDYIDMGFYIGIGGVVTFDKSKKLPEAVEKIPLEKILIETDAPYQTPVPHRGKRNDSSYLLYIAETIAKIKKTTVETVAEATKKNAEELFNVSST